MIMSARDRQVARETVRPRSECPHCNPGRSQVVKIKFSAPEPSAMAVDGPDDLLDVATNMRYVYVDSKLVGMLYGVAENPKTPNRPTAYAYVGLSGVKWRESRLEEARDRLRRHEESR